jgi:hypothetical protein
VLTHIVLLELDDDAAVEEVLRQAHTLAELDVVLRLKVGRDVEGTPQSFDGALVAQFSGLADLEAFEQHPVHRRWCELVSSHGGRTATVTFAEQWAASLQPLAGGGASSGLTTTTP